MAVHSPGHDQYAQQAPGQPAFPFRSPVQDSPGRRKERERQDEGDSYSDCRQNAEVLEGRHRAQNIGEKTDGGGYRGQRQGYSHGAYGGANRAVHILTSAYLLAIAGCDMDPVVHSQPDQEDGNDLGYVVERCDDSGSHQQHPDPLHESDGGEDGEERQEGVGQGPAPRLDQGTLAGRFEPVDETQDDQNDQGGHSEEASDLAAAVSGVFEQQVEAERDNFKPIWGRYGAQGLRHLQVVLDGLIKCLFSSTAGGVVNTSTSPPGPWREPVAVLADRER